jgi:DNA modification methylase
VKTYISLRNEHRIELPEEFRKDDVRYCEPLVEFFLEEFTNEGDVIFDPFMGFGTTLLVAERLNRVAYGVEYEESRWRYVQSLLRNSERALHGDSTKMNSIEVPNFDFTITSPPYMGKHHKENPFTAYSTVGNGYGEYLQTIQDVYRQLNTRLNADGHAVIEVANLKHEDGSLTTLAWDIANEVSEVMRFEGEIVVTWENSYAYGYDHSYCLVFAKK